MRLTRGAGLLMAVVVSAAPLESTLAGHMAQHVVLMTLAPLLIVAGWRPARLPVVPVVAAHNLAVWLWHLPGPFDAAERTTVWHVGEHATLLATGMLFWAVVLTRGIAGVVAAFATSLSTGLLGALLAFSGQPWYAAHPSIAEQQAAGALMWAAGGLAYLVAGSATFARRVLVAGVVALVAGAAGCGVEEAAPVANIGPGYPEGGRRAIVTYGCGTCHVIPGVRGADGLVGPPLNAFGRRSFIAGALPNTPENLALWIRDPQSVEPGTAMPNLNLSEQESLDVAAYLESLR